MPDTPRGSAAGQPSEDVAAEIAYGGGRSENVQVPARCTPIRCQTCKRATDDPAHVYGCDCACKRAVEVKTPVTAIEAAVATVQQTLAENGYNVPEGVIGQALGSAWPALLSATLGASFDV